MCYIYTVECHSAIKMNKIMPFVATGMDLEVVILSEVSQTEKGKHHMASLMCGISKEMNRWAYKKFFKEVLDYSSSEKNVLGILTRIALNL